MGVRLKFNLYKNLLKQTPTMFYQNFKNFEFSLTIKPKNLLLVGTFLKKHINYQYVCLSAISGTDLLKANYRFLVSYELLSLVFSARLRIKLFTDEYNYVPSLVPVFINANWWEREIWDLFGLFFHKHPDLRRILTDYGFEGHPLRKDFPLFGFYEIRYDNTKKSMLYENVSFSQEFRLFNLNSPW